MDIRILNYIVIILFGLIFELAKNHNNKNIHVFRKLYIIIICILLGTESAFRHLVTGPDTITYFNTFQEIKYLSWNDTFRNFYYCYVEGTARDPGFYLLIKIFQCFSLNWQLFLCFIASFYFWALYDFIKNNTNHIRDVVFAFILYVSLFQIIGLSPIRQQIAFAFAFFAFNYIKSQKKIKFFFLVLIGSQFHISILLIVIFWGLSFMGKKTIKIIYVASILLSPIIFTFALNTVAVIAAFMKNPYYMGYAESEGLGGAVTYIIICVLVAIFGLINLRKNTNVRIIRLYYLAIALTTFFVPLTFINGALIRISQYFSLYMMVFIPVVINNLKFNYKSKLLVLSISIIVLIVMTLRNPFEYYYFWQKV